MKWKWMGKKLIGVLKGGKSEGQSVTTAQEDLKYTLVPIHKTGQKK